jgi:hypothetical protein
MKIVTNKNTVFQIIFILCVAVPYLNNYELTFAVWFFSTLISLRKNYSSSIFNLTLTFCLILFLAIITSFFGEYKLYNIIRDLTYLLKPILGLLVGYQICKTHLNNPLKTAIYAGVFIAIVHLYIVFYSFLILGIRNIHELRGQAGYFSDYEVYALILILFNKNLEITLSPRVKNVFILLITISSLFYLSRTNFIQFAVLFIAMKGYFVLNTRTILILSTISITTIFLYSTILFINPRRNGAGIEAFLYKVKIAPIEPFKTKIDLEDYKDFNDNYRSVESILTIKESLNLDTYKIIFGQGLGSTIDLQQKVYLDNVEMRHISVLHNGFMTVYLKSGIVGVLLLLFSILLLPIHLSKLKEFKNINHLLIGTTLFLFISYWVFMGLYFKADTKSILIGLIFAFIEKRKKEILKEKSELVIE